MPRFLPLTVRIPLIIAIIAFNATPIVVRINVVPFSSFSPPPPTSTAHNHMKVEAITPPLAAVPLMILN